MNGLICATSRDQIQCHVSSVERDPLRCRDALQAAVQCQHCAAHKNLSCKCYCVLTRWFHCLRSSCVSSRRRLISMVDRKRLQTYPYIYKLYFKTSGITTLYSSPCIQYALSISQEHCVPSQYHLPSLALLFGSFMPVTGTTQNFHNHDPTYMPSMLAHD